MSGTSERERLWLALSDLFLDTESRGELPRIAQVALDSGYSWDVVERIYQEEVAPVVGPNLFELAGDWAGFPEDWLFARIRGRAPGTTRVSLQASEILHDQWLVISRIYHRLAELPALQAGERSQAWMRLAWLFLTPVWPDSHYFHSFLEACLEPARQAQLMDDFGWLEPIYRPLWIHPGDPGLHQIRLNWSQCRLLMEWAVLQRALSADLLNSLQVLFLGPQLNPAHPAFKEIAAGLNRLSISPARARSWLDSPWADWLALGQPRRREWARSNWTRHLAPLLS
ncbi:MAG: hypothetical protein U0931_06165 [Vulcanimicrobiota bacterium]